ACVDAGRSGTLDANYQGGRRRNRMKATHRRLPAVRRALFAGVLVAFAASAAAQTKPPSDTLEQRVKACSICHGDQGEGLRKNEYYPRLAGKPTGYLYNQLINFRDRRREFAIMNFMVAYLSDTYLLEIADHYAKLDTPYPGAQKRAPAETLAMGGK